MDWQAWITVATVAMIMALFAFTRLAPDLIMLAGVTLLLVCGVLKPSEAFAGFANDGVITVAVLFVVAAGLRETGGVAIITQRLLGRPRTVTGAQIRMIVPIAVASAFMNNTPLVAMTMPAVSEWARNLRFSASKLLMPLSYAAICGGLCSLIGTSTNVVVNGLWMNQAHQPSLGMFDITWLGVPCAVVGAVYMVVASRWLLPDRRPAFSAQDDAREYTVEMLVEPGSTLVGKSVEDAGLRHLQGVYLMEIEREGEILPAVEPTVRLNADDRLIFVGVVESIVDLQKVRGLRPATNQVFKLDSHRSQRCLVEAVVSNTCPLVGMTIRDGRFRTVYNAAVIAVARNGERIRKKIGDIVLRVGDTLLLETHPSFVAQQRNSRHFFLVSAVDESRPLRHERAWVGLGILALLVIMLITGWVDPLRAALVAGGLMIITRCCTATAARRSVDWQVMIAIGASVGIGRAMENTGAAEMIASKLVGLGGNSAWVALFLMYGVTMLFTELLSNNAAVVLAFPLAMATANALGVSPMPFLMSITIAASCGFATPIGYQTHLMVYGPGGYRFSDFLRFGIPLNILFWIVTAVLAPLIWPF
ncbi:MAG: SLC13 family permease [Phycisphaerales bacterium]|nr:SLC13 family permease [Phycisphaerales bacterium]